MLLPSALLLWLATQKTLCQTSPYQFHAAKLKYMSYQLFINMYEFPVVHYTNNGLQKNINEALCGTVLTDILVDSSSEVLDLFICICKKILASLG